MTIIERDIYGAAHFLIEKHGDDAEFEAAQRADHFLELGDHDGKALWLRIKRAVAEMQSETGTRH
ncbi:MAG: hypothetical protein IID51_10015 [Proteobacteria bacterium]|nr:hypothetical protein [Pseudomonadota bacterium]